MILKAIPLLQKHLEFLLERYEHVKEQETHPDDLNGLLTMDWMLSEMDKTVSKGAGHLTEVSRKSMCLTD